MVGGVSAGGVVGEASPGGVSPGTGGVLVGSCSVWSGLAVGSGLVGLTFTGSGARTTGTSSGSALVFRVLPSLERTSKPIFPGTIFMGLATLRLRKARISSLAGAVAKPISTVSLPSLTCQKVSGLAFPAFTALTVTPAGTRHINRADPTLRAPVMRSGIRVVSRTSVTGSSSASTGVGCSCTASENFCTVLESAPSLARTVKL